MYRISVFLEPFVRCDPFLNECRIVHSHTHIKTKKQEVEVQSQSHTPVCCNTFAKCVPSKPSFLYTRALQSPDITSINEQSSCKFPIYIESVFDIGLQSHVSGLIRNDKVPIHCSKSRTDCSCLPST